jgi:hypothetical protein
MVMLNFLDVNFFIRSLIKNPCTEIFPHDVSTLATLFWYATLTYTKNYPSSIPNCAQKDRIKHRTWELE